MQASVLLHFFPRKRIRHCFQEQLFFLGSMLSNDVAQNTSPMKVEAGVGIAKGCCVGARLSHLCDVLEASQSFIMHKGRNPAD